MSTPKIRLEQKCRQVFCGRFPTATGDPDKYGVLKQRSVTTRICCEVYQGHLIPQDRLFEICLRMTGQTAGQVVFGQNCWWGIGWQSPELQVQEILRRYAFVF